MRLLSHLGGGLPDGHVIKATRIDYQKFYWPCWFHNSLWQLLKWCGWSLYRKYWLHILWENKTRNRYTLARLKQLPEFPHTWISCLSLPIDLISNHMIWHEYWKGYQNLRHFSRIYSKIHCFQCKTPRIPKVIRIHSSFVRWNECIP